MASATQSTLIAGFLLLFIVLGYYFILDPEMWTGIFYPSSKTDPKVMESKRGLTVMGGVISSSLAFLLAITFRDPILKGWGYGKQSSY